MNCIGLSLWWKVSIAYIRWLLACSRSKTKPSQSDHSRQKFFTEVTNLKVYKDDQSRDFLRLRSYSLPSVFSALFCWCRHSHSPHRTATTALPPSQSSNMQHILCHIIDTQRWADIFWRFLSTIFPSRSTPREAKFVEHVIGIISTVRDFSYFTDMIDTSSCEAGHRCTRLFWWNFQSECV